MRSGTFCRQATFAACVIAHIRIEGFGDDPGLASDAGTRGRHDIMIKMRNTLGKQAFKFAMAGIAASCLGAAVVAAPTSFISKGKIQEGGRQLVEERTAFSGLSKGPALLLERAAPGEDEDCVRVVRMTGPDGRVFVARGLICAD